jgi:hypothetical protein
MRLRRQPFVIDPAEPFKGALYRRALFAKSLTSLVRKASDGMVIFVNAPWGAGKTTFSRMWQGQLKNEGLNCISFDAYSSDYFADPFVSFTGEILGLLKRELDKANGVEDLTRKFWNASASLTKAAVPVAARIAVKMGTLGLIGNTEIDAVSAAVDDVVDATGSTAEEAIKRALEGYDKEKSSLSEFRRTLREVAKLFHEQHNFPLTIIVDELDRCRPSFALELLERIKHIFDIPGVVFILLVNQEQIESYVKKVYGEQVDAPTYLHKFGDLFVDLPAAGSGPRFTPGLAELYRTLLREFEIEIESPSIIAQDMEIIGGHFGLTLRDLEHVARIIALDRAALTDNDFCEYPAVELFSIVRVKIPRLFVKIRDASIKGEEAVEELRLTKLATLIGSERAELIYSASATLMHASSNIFPHQSIKQHALRLQSRYGRSEYIATSVCRRLERFKFGI